MGIAKEYLDHNNLPYDKYLENKKRVDLLEMLIKKNQTYIDFDNSNAIVCTNYSDNPITEEMVIFSSEWNDCKYNPKNIKRELYEEITSLIK